MRWQLLIKQGIIFLFAIFTIEQVKADTFIPMNIDSPTISTYQAINFATTKSYSNWSYNYMTEHNRRIKINASTTGETINVKQINYTFRSESNTVGKSAGWAITVDPNWQIYSMSNGVEVYRKSSSPNLGFIIKINGVPVKNGFLDSGRIIAKDNIDLTANIEVELIEIEGGTTSSDINATIPIFGFYMTSAYLSSTQQVIYDSVKKSYHFQFFNPVNGTPYISFCQTINSPDPSNVTLADITTKEFLSSNRSQVYSTFKLSVKNCGATNTVKDWWRNDVEAVYVTFSDANGSSSSTILKNTGTAKGVGFSIYPEGSEQPVKFSAPNTEIYGTPEDNNPLKNDGTATEMNYTKNSETVTVPKRLGYYDSYTVVLGSAEKTFRVYYARDPSQGEEVKAGSVVGKATFTFSYQ